MALTTFLFWAVAALTSLSAIAVVVAQNIVRAAVWLLFALAGTAGLFFLLGADFVAATQLLVYVGGTLVLVVFGVMLTAQGPFISMKTSAVEWAISAAVGLLLLSVLVVSVIGFQPYAGPAANPRTGGEPVTALYRDEPARSQNTLMAGLGFLGFDVGPYHLEKKEKAAQNRTSYLLPFEIVSVHLLVVLVGAAYLARAKRRRGLPS
jgi:NADH-quinone oxidoreductase subunit J